jgi:hypothetical protein
MKASMRVSASMAGAAPPPEDVTAFLATAARAAGEEGLPRRLPSCGLEAMKELTPFAEA